jgi:hypothetical protein
VDRVEAKVWANAAALRHSLDQADLREVFQAVFPDGLTFERDAPKPIVGYKQKIGHGAGAQSRSPQQFGSSSHVSASSTSLLASVNSLASVDSTVRGDSSDRVDARTGPGIVRRCSISDGVTPHPQARGKTSAIAYQKKRV